MTLFDGRPQSTIQRILEAVGRDELRRILPRIGSSTLRKALRLIVEANQGRARLFIPHYWAVYYHDGRGGFGPKSARKLVFFDDPRDDPRAPTPERQAQVRRLTRAEYEEGLRRNALRRAAGFTRPFMYVVSSVGPAAGNPFFEDASRNAAVINGPEIARIFSEEVREALRNDRVLRDRGTERAVARLGRRR